VSTLKKTLEEFSRIFDKFRNAEFHNIDEQFSKGFVNVDKNRFGLDIASNALESSVNKIVVKDDYLIYTENFMDLCSRGSSGIGKTKND
jgi:hypothetical protein